MNDGERNHGAIGALAFTSSDSICEKSTGEGGERCVGELSDFGSSEYHSGTWSRK